MDKVACLTKVDCLVKVDCLLREDCFMTLEVLLESMAGLASVDFLSRPGMLNTRVSPLPHKSSYVCEYSR